MSISGTKHWELIGFVMLAPHLPRWLGFTIGGLAIFFAFLVEFYHEARRAR